MGKKKIYILEQKDLDKLKTRADPEYQVSTSFLVLDNSVPKVIFLQEAEFSG